MTTLPDPIIPGYIAGWRPSSVSPRTAAFARPAARHDVGKTVKRGQAKKKPQAEG